MAQTHFVVFGAGYSGTAIARDAASRGWRTTLVSRDPASAHAPRGVGLAGFVDAADLIAVATHIVATAAPGEAGDPVLVAHGDAIARAPDLRWAGYISTTGVYGDRGGEWVDEDSVPAPGSPRARRRVAAEASWLSSAGGIAVDILRSAGIYGPGRSALDDVRSGHARRIVKPGHEFGRVHRDDIAGAVIAAAAQDRVPGPRILHLADDLPAGSADVIAEAARLLGVEPPPAVAFEDAVASMSEMGRSFWSENRKVASRKTQAAIGRTWRYPSYREGLAAIFAEERADRPA